VVLTVMGEGKREESEEESGVLHFADFLVRRCFENESCFDFLQRRFMQKTKAKVVYYQTGDWESSDSPF
jgi:hypothetical protein